MQNDELGQGDRAPENEEELTPHDFTMNGELENMNKEDNLHIEDAENEEGGEERERHEEIKNNEAEEARQEEFENSFDIENYEENQQFVYAENELEQTCFKEEQVKEISTILQENKVEIAEESHLEQEAFSPVFNELHRELENNERIEEGYEQSTYHNNQESEVQEFNSSTLNQLNSEKTQEGQHNTEKEFSNSEEIVETENRAVESNIKEEFVENEERKNSSELELKKREETDELFAKEEEVYIAPEIPLTIDDKEEARLVEQEDKNYREKENEEIGENEEIKPKEIKITEVLSKKKITEVVLIKEMISEDENKQQNTEKEKINEVKTEKKEKEPKTKTKKNKKEKHTNENKNKSDKQTNDNSILPIVPIKKTQIEEQKTEEMMEKAQVSTAIDIEPEPPKDGGNSLNPHDHEGGGESTDPTLSLIPVIIIKEAQKERISSILDQFEDFLERHRAYIVHQKRTIVNVENEIEIRKQKKYVWYHYIREYFLQYLDLTTQFHDVSYKGSKQSISSNENELLNMNKYFGEGVHDLSFLKRETANEYMNLGSLVSGELSLALESVFNKFISEIKRIQSDMLKKKEEFIEKEDILRKRIEKNTKIYTRGRLGKKVTEDVFVETCMFIEAEKIFRKALINWGVGLKELRESFIALEQKLNNEIQMVVNNFKTASCSLYSFHPQSFSKIISSKEEITKSTHFSDLCSLIDSDYIKYTYETATKTVIAEVSDNQFQKFMEMPHFEEIVGKPSDLLKGVINKSIHLKAEGEQLVNSISGNLVLFNSINSEYKDKFVVKNLSATIVGDGLIQFDEILPGFIFNDTRTIRLEFKDQDRAEELICLLNEIE